MARRRRKPEDVSATSGAWEGVIEDLTRVTNADQELAYLENAYIVEGRVRARPALARFASPVLASPVQGLGSARSRSGQVLNWMVKGGRLWVGEGAAPATEVALGGYVLSNIAERVYGVVFADYLILSDGLNRPRKVALSTLAVSDITHFAVPAYGPPKVYYDKLFFVLAGNRIEMQWSEEGDPDNGYVGPCAGSGFYENAWELRQTSQDILTVLAPSNSALAYFRQGSSGVILGAATDEFRAQGVSDGISEKLGSLTPDALVLDDGAVWFADQYGRPARASMGGGAAPITGPQVELRTTLNRETLERILIEHHSDLGLVLYAHPMSGDYPKTVLVFGDGVGRAPRYYGRWVLPSSDIRAMGVWRIDGLEAPDVLVIGDGQGNAWGFRDPVPVSHQDVLAVDGSIVQTFTRIARTAPMAYAPGEAKLFDMLVVQATTPPGTKATGPVLVSYLGPKTGSTPQALYPRASWVDGQNAGTPSYAAAGIAAMGSSLQVTISSSHPDSGYDFTGVTVKGAVDGEQWSAI